MRRLLQRVDARLPQRLDSIRAVTTKSSSSSSSGRPRLTSSPQQQRQKQKRKQQQQQRQSWYRPRGLFLCLAPAAFAVPAYVLDHAIAEPPSLSLWSKRSLGPPTPSAIESLAPITVNMSADTSKIPPGRPETLTADEEKKLKELWNTSLRVFGVAGDSAESSSATVETAQESTPAATPDREESPATAEEKKKKKSLGRLLSRRDKKDTSDKPKEPPTPSGSNNNSLAGLAPMVINAVNDANDKYGHGKEFQAALASQTPTELREAFWDMTKCDDPDGLLLRFLRARKWDVERALVMMVATMNWRAKEMDVAGVVQKGEGGALADGDEGFMKQLRMGKSFLHGTDKDGRPICFVRVRLHKAGDQSEQSLERYTIYIMETARLMLRSPVDTATIVFDMTDFSMANMDYAPVKFMIKCFEAHYPESLGQCLVHKAPWVFQGIWAIIRGWLDPVVAGKVHFTRTLEDLKQYIPESQIIKELGGAEDWEYSYIEPVAGEDDATKDIARLEKLKTERASVVKQYEEQTRKWIASEGDEAKEARNKRTELTKQLVNNYWEMDRHIRGRTLYDRTGVLRPDGQLDFYPVKAKAPETSADDID